jgi:preprotein translocase subunit SecB
MADEQPPAERQLQLQTVYIKGFSLQSPQTPEVFASDIDSQIDFDVRSASRTLNADAVEVTLTLTVKSITREDTIFSIKLAQAGIFVIKGYTPEQRFALLGTFCPGTLYAYAREAVSGLVEKAGFPQLLAQPLDFDGLFAQSMRERAAQARAQPPQPSPEPSGSGEPQ